MFKFSNVNKQIFKTTNRGIEVPTHGGLFLMENIHGHMAVRAFHCQNNNNNNNNTSFLPKSI